MQKREVGSSPAELVHSTHEEQEVQLRQDYGGTCELRNMNFTQQEMVSQ